MGLGLREKVGGWFQALSNFNQNVVISFFEGMFTILGIYTAFLFSQTFSASGGRITLTELLSFPPELLGLFSHSGLLVAAILCKLVSVHAQSVK